MPLEICLSIGASIYSEIVSLSVSFSLNPALYLKVSTYLDNHKYPVAIFSVVQSKFLNSSLVICLRLYLLTQG